MKGKACAEVQRGHLVVQEVTAVEDECRLDH